MKNLKIGAVVLAMLFVAFSAFTTKKSTSAVWFEFTGEEVTLTELMKAENYVFASSTVAPCNHSEQICGIRYEGDQEGVSIALESDTEFQARLQDVLDGLTDADIVEKDIE
jgi:hypothetical protein